MTGLIRDPMSRKQLQHLRNFGDDEVIPAVDTALHYEARCRELEDERDGWRHTAGDEATWKYEAEARAEKAEDEVERLNDIIAHLTEGQTQSVHPEGLS